MDMGRREERVRCMERVTWKLILPYVKETCISLFIAALFITASTVRTGRTW